LADPTDPTDTTLVDRFASYKVDRDNAAFYRGWLAHELRINRCADCVVPTAVSGRGRVHLLMRLHQGPSAPGVDYSAGPYPVVTVELEEQVALRYTSTVVNCDPTAIAIDMPVQLAWIDRYGAPFPVFEPAKV
jgi:uncharacterized OB-fold protein